MNVEIWADIACPWCYIGKRRFEAALAEFEHRGQVNVTWPSPGPTFPKRAREGGLGVGHEATRMEEGSVRRKLHR